MKKIFTLSIILGCVSSIFAYDLGSILSITSARNINTVVVDGRSYAVRSQERTFEVRNLRQGSHTIKVYSASGSYRNASRRLIYEGRFYARNGYQTEIMINSFGRAYVDAQRVGAEVDDDHIFFGTGFQNYNSHRAMDEAAFGQLKSVLQKEKFDQTRANIAKQSVKSNYFETQQVMEILRLFSFEDSKLELAKLFYDSTVDKGNYVSVYDVFTFSSSKDELAMFLATKNKDPEFR